MENSRQHFDFFLEQPLRASVAIAAFGFVLMWLVVPPMGREDHTPLGFYETHEACRTAGHLVVGLAAMLCVSNALRSGKSEPREFDMAILWSLVLCVWMLLSLSRLLAWWQHLDPALRPPWLQELLTKVST